MRRFPLLLVLLATLTACADAGIVGGGTGSLEGRAFLSQSVVGRDLVPGTQIRLSFTDGNVGATAGCNSMGGPYTLEGDTLVIGAEGLAMTEIGCDPPRHDQDSWLAELLGSEPTIVLAGADLTLTSGSTVIELLDREVADPDRDLVGTTWVVDSIISGEAVSSFPPGPAVTLTFGDDSTFSAESQGCTSATGSMEFDDDTITFGTFAVDDIGCPSPWSETLRVLQAGETSYTIDVTRLTIEAGDVGISAVAED